MGDTGYSLALHWPSALNHPAPTISVPRSWPEIPGWCLPWRGCRPRNFAKFASLAGRAALDQRRNAGSWVVLHTLPPRSRPWPKASFYGSHGSSLHSDPDASPQSPSMTTADLMLACADAAWRAFMSFKSDQCRECVTESARRT